MSLGMSSEVAAACVHCSELLCLQLCWSKQYWLQCSACAKTSWRTFLEKYGRFCSLTVLLHCSYSPEFCFAFQTRASLLCWMQNIFNVSVCFEMTCIEYKLAYLLCGNGGRCWHMLIRPFTCSCCTNWAQNVWAAFKERSCFSCWTGHAHQSLLHCCLQPLNSAYTLDSELFEPSYENIQGWHLPCVRLVRCSLSHCGEVLLLLFLPGQESPSRTVLSQRKTKNIDFWRFLSLHSDWALKHWARSNVCWSHAQDVLRHWQHMDHINSVSPL